MFLFDVQKKEGIVRFFRWGRTNSATVHMIQNVDSQQHIILCGCAIFVFNCNSAKFESLRIRHTQIFGQYTTANVTVKSKIILVWIVSIWLSSFFLQIYLVFTNLNIYWHRTKKNFFVVYCLFIETIASVYCRISNIYKTLWSFIVHA